MRFFQSTVERRFQVKEMVRMEQIPKKKVTKKLKKVNEALV